MKRTVHGGDEAVHPDIAASLNGLGAVCYREADLKGAERFFEDAWTMQVEMTSEGHPDALTLFGNLQDVRELMNSSEGQKMMERYETRERMRRKQDKKKASLEAPVLQRSESAEERAEKARQDLLMMEEEGAAGEGGGGGKKKGGKKGDGKKKKKKKKKGGKKG